MFYLRLNQDLPDLQHSRMYLQGCNSSLPCLCRTQRLENLHRRLTLNYWSTCPACSREGNSQSKTNNLLDTGLARICANSMLRMQKIPHATLAIQTEIEIPFVQSSVWLQLQQPVTESLNS